MRRNAALHRAPDVDDTSGELARREVRFGRPWLGCMGTDPFAHGIPPE